MLFRSSVVALAGCIAAAQAKVQFLGVAIAGMEFGCAIDGTCDVSSIQDPSAVAGDQMNHFVKDDSMNMFRLPFSWQYLTGGKGGGTLDATNWKKVDSLMQACLKTGAYCMIEVHNFARYNGGIIGQGGPTDADFVGLWSAIATNYAKEDKVVFELMNEPHELDIKLWAATCQKVINAIRKVAGTQMILLPGTNFDSAATLISSGSADALLALTNPDGTTDGLLLDIHKYLDVDNSGNHLECVMDNVDSFTALAAYLRKAGRQGLVSETGASSDATCLTAFCAQNNAINQNADVFVGLVAWGAGSFTSDYPLNLSPVGTTDVKILTQCVLGPWNDAKNGGTPSTTPKATTTTGSIKAASSTSGTTTTTGTSKTSTSTAASTNTTTSAASTATTMATTTSTGGTGTAAGAAASTTTAGSGANSRAVVCTALFGLVFLAMII